MDFEDLQEFAKTKDLSGVVYLSRVPPGMAPHEVRTHFSAFGNLNRVYLEPLESTTSKKSNNKRRRHTPRFKHGWIEFVDKGDAKTAVLALNGHIVGGRKGGRHHDDLWTCKYLPGLKWTDLTDEMSYKKNQQEERLKNERAQARREAAFYIRQSDKARHLGKHAKLPASAAETMANLKTTFRQRQPIL